MGREGTGTSLGTGGFRRSECRAQGGAHRITLSTARPAGLENEAEHPAIVIRQSRKRTGTSAEMLRPFLCVARAGIGLHSTRNAQAPFRERARAERASACSVRDGGEGGRSGRVEGLSGGVVLEKRSLSAHAF